MPDQKLENLLNLAMNALPKERAKSENLNVGYDPTTRLWDVIVKYSGPESGLGGERIQVVPLLGGYAVVTLPEVEIAAYSVREQIEFIEKPKRLYFETFEGGSKLHFAGAEWNRWLNRKGDFGGYCGFRSGLFPSGFQKRGWQYPDPATVGSECSWKSTGKLCIRN